MVDNKLRTNLKQKKCFDGSNRWMVGWKYSVLSAFKVCPQKSLIASIPSSLCTHVHIRVHCHHQERGEPTFVNGIIQTPSLENEKLRFFDSIVRRRCRSSKPLPAFRVFQLKPYFTWLNGKKLGLSIHSLTTDGARDWLVYLLFTLHTHNTSTDQFQGISILTAVASVWPVKLGERGEGGKKLSKV